RFQHRCAVRRQPHAVPAGAARSQARHRRDRGGVRTMNAKRMKAPRTLDEFMVKAYEMEIEASERYAEFADAMETHNNREVAELFRKMSEIEGKHATQIMAEMGWKSPPAPGKVVWQSFEGPETIAMDEVHYL